MSFSVAFNSSGEDSSRDIGPVIPNCEGWEPCSATLEVELSLADMALICFLYITKKIVVFICVKID